MLHSYTKSVRDIPLDANFPRPSRQIEVGLKGEATHQYHGPATSSRAYCSTAFGAYAVDNAMPVAVDVAVDDGAAAAVAVVVAAAAVVAAAVVVVVVVVVVGDGAGIVALVGAIVVGNKIGAVAEVEL